MFIIAPFISHRVKRFRSIAVVTVTLIVMFYYTFLNEEYEMNQHLLEEELPRITTDKPDESSQSKEYYDRLALMSPEGLMEKNKYFPLLEPEKARSKLKTTIPEDYIINQKNVKLRDFKKHHHYEIGTENYYKLPKLSKPDDYPMIQSSYFNDGGLKDEVKLKRISNAFDKSWSTYTKYGYGHDEVTPLSHTPEDAFNGWAATLVDALDTMLLMNKKEEFNRALEFVSNMNFKQSYRDDIPLFENVIRILAGLISGFEMSKEKIFLEKAKELAELLMEAFDTPNNMPLLYYEWRSEIQNRFASKDAALAEVGSLSLEFSRLTQLTKNNKYFDAVTRITKILNDSYNEEFYLPGLYTNRLDISGCQILTDEEIENGLHLNNPKVIKSIQNKNYIHCLSTDKIKPTGVQKYSIGGLADSFYEYLPKMYHLLRGSKNSKDAMIYKEMYLRAIKQMKEFMIFKPKIPNNEAILFISSIFANPEGDMIDDQQISVHQDLDMQHLSCFAGGMFALGSRLFDIPQDMEIAGNLTYGCVQMYERLKIMPEILWVDKVMGVNDVYNETKRLELIKPIMAAYSSYEYSSAYGSKVGDGEKDSIITDTDDDDFKIGIIDNDEDLKKAIKNDAENLISKRDNTLNGVKEVNKPKLKTKSSAKIPSNSKPKNFESWKKVIVEPKDDRLPQERQRVLPNGDKIWTVGETENQPVWMNKIEAKYILRPEAIESVVYMYRITGDSKWRDYGWKMWENVEKYAKTEDDEYASVWDITNLGGENNFMDTLESFWFSETLKYFYLLFEDVSVWSFDDYVFNTEAHPFRLEN